MPPASAATATADPAAPSLTGLSDAEARLRRNRGEGNTLEFAPSRSVWEIVRDNALMSINVIIFAVGVALIVMGLVNDAIVTVGLVLLNVLIAVAQELRAKRALDRIALLSRMQATVLRDGVERRIDPAGIVRGDLLIARSGDQVMVDGRIVRNGQVALDESLLTGESDPVSRTVGDRVFAGSFVVSGEMTYEAELVGFESRANQLTAQARVFRTEKTPVQREIDLVLRLMVLLILVLGGPIVLDIVVRLLGMAVEAVDGPFADTLGRAYQGYPLQESVRAIAVVVGLVPQGVALMLTVTYALGALRLTGKGALLQQANGIESLSHVDVVCFDKTGTLTTNRLAYHDARPLGGASSTRLAVALGDYAATTRSRNRTIEAIAAAYPGTARPVREEVPFSSARKWSALGFAEEHSGTFVLGAPEVLQPALAASVAIAPLLERWTAAGLRVLLLAWSPEPLPPAGPDGEARLPAALEPVGLVSFQDELQPEASHTFARFAAEGIAVKIISGDNPETVAALTRQAGFGRDRELTLISGIELAAMDTRDIADAAERGDIFGRISPEQKLALIEHLQAREHYVAMIGDGVNDVLALKQAQVGIAMEHGSQATRAVADLVLLGNAFGALPPALQEGRRIVRASQDLLKLFLTRSLSITIAILGAGIIGVAFPLVPTQNALPAALAVGIPAFFLAAWTRPAEVPRGLMRNVLPFVGPAALTIGIIETTLYIAYVRVTADIDLARSVVAAVATACGLLAIFFVRPPSERWVAIAPLQRDWRVIGLVVAMVIALLISFAEPRLRDFLALTPLGPVDVLLVIAASLGWAWAIRGIWRNHLLHRLLGIPRRRDLPPR